MISGDLWSVEGLPRGPRRQQPPSEPQEPAAKAADVDAMKREIGTLKTAILQARGDGAVLTAMRERIALLEAKLAEKTAEPPQKLPSVWDPVQMTRGRTRR